MNRPAGKIISIVLLVIGVMLSLTGFGNLAAFMLRESFSPDSTSAGIAAAAGWMTQATIYLLFGAAGVVLCRAGMKRLRQ